MRCFNYVERRIVDFTSINPVSSTHKVYNFIFTPLLARG